MAKQVAEQVKVREFVPKDGSVETASLRITASGRARATLDLPLTVLQDANTTVLIEIYESDDGVNWQFACSSVFRGGATQNDQPWQEVNGLKVFVKTRATVRHADGCQVGCKIENR